MDHFLPVVDRKSVLSGAGCSSRWFLRLASAAAFTTHQADLRLTGHIKQFWLDGMRLWLSQAPSGSAGQRATVRSKQSLATDETCRDKGSRLIPEPAGTKWRGHYLVAQQAPATVQSTDITYIRTHECWLYPVVFVDMFSRKIIGWSMQSWMIKDIVLNVLVMAVWRCNPQKQVLVHSVQGSQYTIHEWQSFLKSHSLEGSMSSRGNCHDDAVAQNFSSF